MAGFWVFFVVVVFLFLAKKKKRLLKALAHTLQINPLLKSPRAVPTINSCADPLEKSLFI